MDVGGLLGDMFLGAVSGGAKGGLEQLMLETKRAEEEGLARLQAELDRENIEYEDTLETKRTETERGYALEDEERKRKQAFEDAPKLTDLEIDKLRKQEEVKKEFREPKEVPAEVQKLKYLKGEGLLESYVNKDKEKQLSKKDLATLRKDAEVQATQLVRGEYGEGVPTPEEQQQIDAVADQLFKKWTGEEAAPAARGPKPGEIVKGYKFKGGDPNKKENWEKI